jgi:hypothetical protein
LRLLAEELAHPQKGVHPQIQLRALSVFRPAGSLEAVFIDEVFAANGSLATREQLLAVMSRKMLEAHLKAGAIVRVWHGVYESAMESEARLVFIDGGLPMPELQYEIVDRCGQLWRVDFAWPDAKVAAEYESMEWHANAAALKHDRIKTSRLQECGWTTIPIVVDDVRHNPIDLIGRIFTHLERASLAG